MSTSQALISRLGTIMQMAYVPEDMDGALRYWTETMGVGPFFKIANIQVDAARYKGEPASIDFSVYIAYWGDMQIELIEQYNVPPQSTKAGAARAGKACTTSASWWRTWPAPVPCAPKPAPR